MLILIGAVPERLVHGHQSRLHFPTSLAPPGPAIGFSTATLIQGIFKLSKTENRIEKLLLVHVLLSFLFSPIAEKWLVVFGPYCIISAYTQDYELKFTR